MDPLNGGSHLTNGDKAPVEVERFRSLLTMSMVSNGWSQRKLCEAMGITMGTMTKYFKGKIAPSQVRGSLMRCLAKTLGVTTDAIYGYLETGEFQSELTVDDVASWIRSHGQEELPIILAAISDSANQSAVKQPKLEPAGYSDEEAREWCSYITETLKELCNAGHMSLRSAWQQVEAKLTELELSAEEIDTCYDVTTGARVFTGQEMNALRARYAARCPLIIAFKAFDVVQDCAPLLSASRMCQQNVA